MYTKVLFAAVIAFTFNSCDKHEEDTVSPSITIAKPLENQMFKSGDTVVINGTVADHSLHELHVMIHNSDSADKVYWEYMPTIHDMTTFSFNEKWIVPAVADTCDIKLHVKVHDHSENESEKMVMFKIRP